MSELCIWLTIAAVLLRVTINKPTTYRDNGENCHSNYGNGKKRFTVILTAIMRLVT